MLQIRNIKKEYHTGNLVQKALDDVSLNFRDNEFVAILGPSGSGKTTLLNIIGGLDRYDSGDLIINGISTRKYSDRDWDSYRNHTIGFVFQSYNLIPHQTVLQNVELALTIGGISREERRARAEEALRKEGIQKIFGLVFKDNETANAFWEQQGYSLRTNLNYRNKSLNDQIPAGE